MKLTEEQKKMVEENHNLIYWYMAKYNLEISEYYDLLAIELCYAVVHYDESRGSFSNYFKMRADGIIYKEYRKSKAQKREHISVPLLDNLHTLTDDVDLTDMIGFKDLLEGEYGEIVKLRIEGYNQAEIAEMMGTNQSKISKILKQLRDDYMEDDLNENN